MAHWAERLFREQADSYTRFFEERFDDAEDEVAALLALVDEEYGTRPDRALDLACGTGRHVVALADRGLDAEGLDFSAAFVERARENAREHGVAERASVHEHDVRNLDEWTGEGAYDLVTSLWNSLGYYGRAADERLFAEAHRLLGEEGVFAAEVVHAHGFLAEFEPASVSEGEDRLFVERREFDVETGRYHTTLDLFDATDGYEHTESMEWDVRLYAPVVLREMLERAGFADVRLFGGFEGEELTMDSDRLLVLAR